MSSDSEDNYVGASDDSEESASLGDDLTYGQSDAAWLETLSDIAREEVFFERVEKKKDAEEKKRIKRELRQNQKRGENKGFDTPAPVKVKRKQAHALEDLKAKQRELKKKKNKDKSDSSASEAEQDQYDRYAKDNYEEEPVEITISDLKKCIVTRSKLEKWYGEPFFCKNVPGLFVRVICSGLGVNNRTYKLAEIISIVETNKLYKLGKKECRHLATIKIGDLTKKYELEYVSNSEIQEDEYYQWLDVAKREKEVPNRAQIENLVKNIYDAEHYQYSTDDFREQIQKNKEKNPNLLKSSYEILKLKTQIAEETDINKILQYKRQLQANEEKVLENKKQRQGQVGKSLENLNKRNAEINYVLTRTVVEDEEYDEDDGSAFRQKTTASKNSWVQSRSKSSQGSQPIVEDDTKLEDKQAKKKQKLSSVTLSEVIPISDIPLQIQLDVSTLIGNTVTKVEPLNNSDFSLKIANTISTQQMSKQKVISQDAKTMSFADYKKQMGL